MKKVSAILAASIMAASIMACGTETEQATELTSETIEAADNTETPATEEVTTEQADASTLATPTVKDGVIKEGNEGAESYFEWSAVEGADGYEISLLSKYYAEPEFTEPEEIYETTDTNYTFGAQDYFDFLVKVRAYKGEGADRVYGEWSEEAAGFTYEDSELPVEVEFSDEGMSE